MHPTCLARIFKLSADVSQTLMHEHQTEELTFTAKGLRPVQQFTHEYDSHVEQRAFGVGATAVTRQAEERWRPDRHPVRFPVGTPVAMIACRHRR